MIDPAAVASQKAQQQNQQQQQQTQAQQTSQQQQSQQSSQQQGSETAGSIKATEPMWRCSRIMHMQKELHPTVLASLEGIVDQVFLITPVESVYSFSDGKNSFLCNCPSTP